MDVRVWIIKSEHRRIDAFELQCWRRLLRVPWTPRRCNQSILKDINLGVHWKDWYWSWTPVLWWPDVKSWLFGKDPDAGKDWRQKEKGITEDEMIGWHYRLNGHEFEQTEGGSEGQWTLVCCSVWSNPSALFPSLISFHNTTLPVYIKAL